VCVREREDARARYDMREIAVADMSSPRCPSVSRPIFTGHFPQRDVPFNHVTPPNLSHTSFDTLQHAATHTATHTATPCPPTAIGPTEPHYPGFLKCVGVC